MTVITGVTARDMRRMLAGRCNPVVTRSADTNYLSMVDGICRCPDVRVVAVLAYIGCLHMCKVLARGFHTVMAAHAVSRYVDMIKLSRTPGIACMAVVAGIATANMRRVLAGRCEAVMT